MNMAINEDALIAGPKLREQAKSILKKRLTGLFVDYGSSREEMLPGIEEEIEAVKRRIEMVSAYD